MSLALPRSTPECQLRCVLAMTAMVLLRPRRGRVSCALAETAPLSIQKKLFDFKAFVGDRYPLSRYPAGLLKSSGFYFFPGAGSRRRHATMNLWRKSQESVSWQVDSGMLALPLSPKTCLNITGGVSGGGSARVHSSTFMAYRH